MLFTVNTAIQIKLRVKSAVKKQATAHGLAAVYLNIPPLAEEENIIRYRTYRNENELKR